MLLALRYVTVNYPAIDNHAHPLLQEKHRDGFPFESLVTEAEGRAQKDTQHSLAFMRATRQLADSLDLPDDASWMDVKKERAKFHYDALCKKFMQLSKIQCLLLDDGLGRTELTLTVEEHSKFSVSKRIVRVEVEAEKIFMEMFSNSDFNINIMDIFISRFQSLLNTLAAQPDIVGFKSIVCYRSGLQVSTVEDPVAVREACNQVYSMFIQQGKVRLANKPLNDMIVRMTLTSAGIFKKPVQFHTGLGDNDITLALSSPSHLQPVIKAFPHTDIVLLHASYPYTQEAGYLAAVYANVWLDFGEIFPYISADGQRTVLRQMLELTPTNKILWSTDGHWFPESFYLGSEQARQALYDVLSQYVNDGSITERQAIKIVKNALFHNSNRLYKLGLEPVFK